MPASTRSQTKQVSLDDSKELKAPITSNKREADSRSTNGPPKKTSKKSSPDTKNDASPPHDKAGEDVVTINRAPVLELWAASVASLLYPKLPWQTCLSIGGAISTICAISKGRAIGAIDKPDPDNTKEKQEKRRQDAAQLDEVEVMQFHLALKNGNALVSGKPRKANESALKSKFGDMYDTTLDTFKSSLSTWEGKEEDLSAQAFHMYEKFRPTVPAGQKGWGRRGQLSLGTVKDVVGSSTS